MGILDFFLNGGNDKKYRQELGNLDEFGDDLENLENKDIRKEKLMEYEYLSDEDINREN
jgi:hypothetical protein